MNRKYELVYIVSPDASDEQVTDLHTQVEASSSVWRPD
jgi:ribosomal protein S6